MDAREREYMNLLIRLAYHTGFDSLTKNERVRLMRYPGFDMGHYLAHQKSLAPSVLGDAHGYLDAAASALRCAEIVLGGRT